MSERRRKFNICLIGDLEGENLENVRKGNI